MQQELQVRRSAGNRVKNLIVSTLSHIRLGTLYAVIGVAVVLAWLLSAVPGVSSGAASTHSNTTLSTPPASSQTDDLQNQEGGSMPKTESTLDANSDVQSHTSVSATDMGTTVTINGQTQTVPPNQPFSKSYDATTNGNTAHTDVSVDNNTDGSSRSIHVHMHSSTHSSSSGDSSTP